MNFIVIFIVIIINLINFIINKLQIKIFDVMKNSSNLAKIVN